MAAISTCVLPLVFSLPAPTVAVPLGQTLTLLGLAACAEVAALAVAIIVVAQLNPSATLRET